jgi:hypothetical protein
MSFLFSLLCFFSLSISASARAHADEGSQIYAGTANICYTPDSVPESQIMDRQFIRVVAFSDGEKKALLIATELKWIHDPLWERLTKRIKEETGIEEECVLLSAVHTHSGVPQGDDFDDKVVACVKEALARLEPVTIGVGKGECKMNMNRRQRGLDGSIILGKNPYGPCDHEVAILRIDDSRGNPMSIMVNWPCHAVVNWPKPALFSGDWPGVAAQFIEDKLRNKVTVPITVGACGDINPLHHQPYPPNETSSRKKKLLALTARDLGEEAIRVSSDITTYRKGGISAVQRYLSLPGIVRLKSWAPNQEIVQGDDLRVRLTAIKVGNVIFAAYGGEVMNEIGMRLKELSPYDNTFVITLCNGHCGYLVTDKALEEGGLEAGRTRGMPGTDKALVNHMVEMINEL